MNSNPQSMSHVPQSSTSSQTLSKYMDTTHIFSATAHRALPTHSHPTAKHPSKF